MFSTSSVVKDNPQNSDGLPLIFGSAVGTLCMFIILTLYHKKKYWTKVETIVTILIGSCIIVWIIMGPYKALFLGILCEIGVGIYLIIKTINYPVYKYNLTGYILFLLASIIATWAATDWSLPQVGYSISEIILTSITIIPLLIQIRKERALK